jgi:hypothetical protein
MTEEEIADAFYEGMNDVIILAIKDDKTVSLRTSIQDIKEVKAVLSAAYMMATLHDVKRDDFGLDNMH